MGVVANFPLALATGLGLNAFVAYSVATQMTWADAMGLVVLEGLIILILVLTGFRKAVFDAVPRELKTAIAVGIGLFITFIGAGRRWLRPHHRHPGAAGPDGHRQPAVRLARPGVHRGPADHDRRCTRETCRAPS